MPRPLRVHMIGALYYVTSRSAEGQTLFRDERDFLSYLDLIGRAYAQGGVRIYAYLLLPDQLHLCLEPTGELTVSAFMHGVNSRYTKYFAKRHGRTSHLFQDRFKSTLLEKSPNLLRVTGYLHQLPVLSGAAADAAAYRWSSISSYVGAGSTLGSLPLSHESAEVLEQLQREQPGVRYASSLSAVAANEWERIGDELQRRVVGSDAFVADAETLAQLSAREPEVLPVAHEPAQAGAASGTAAASSRREPSWVVAASIVMSVASLAAAAWFGRNLSMVQGGMRALASAVNRQAAEGEPGVTLANFSAPVSLAGTQWQLEIRPEATTTANDVAFDRLMFQGGRLTSSLQSVQGAKPPRYRVTQRSPEHLAWDALHADPSGAIAQWQGETDGRTMRGTLIKQIPGQPTARFSFIGARTANPAVATQET